MERDAAMEREATLAPCFARVPSLMREVDVAVEERFSPRTIFWIAVVMLALQFAVWEDPPTLSEIFDFLVGLFYGDLRGGGMETMIIACVWPSPLQAPIAWLTFFYTAFVAIVVYGAVQARRGRAWAAGAVLLIALVSYPLLEQIGWMLYRWLR